MTRSPLSSPTPGSGHETDLIRAALRRQADRAPAPEPVMAALASRSAAVPQPRRPQFVLLATAAAATVAVAGGVMTLTGSNGQAPAGALPTGTVTAPVAGWPSTPTGPTGTSGTATAWGVALEYSPSRLPAGLKERKRVGYVGGDLVRTWTPASSSAADGDGPLLSLNVRRAAAGGLGDGPGVTDVTVGGLRGRYATAGPGDDKSAVEWQARPGLWVGLTQGGLGLDRAALLRIAESVRPDPGTYEMPFRVSGRLGLAGRGPVDTIITVVRSPRSWEASLAAGPVGITLGTAAERDAPVGGRPVHVAGRTGLYTVRRAGGVLTEPSGGGTGSDVLQTWLVVPLERGQVLTLRAGPLDGPAGEQPSLPVGSDSATPTASPIPTHLGTRAVPVEDMVALAEAVDLRGTPDLSWAR